MTSPLRDALAAPPSRHDLAWLAPEWRAAMRGEVATASAAALDRWSARGLPAVVARRLPGDREGVRLAFPLFAGHGRGVSVLVAPPAIARTSGPLELRLAISSAPAAWRRALRALDAEVRSAGLVACVHGSLAWQHLTGEERVGAASDVDLLLRPRDAVELGRAMALLRRHRGDAAPRLDGELLLPGGRGVAWREVLGGGARLLVKSDRAIALEPRSEVLSSIAIDEAIDVAAIGALRDELDASPKPGLVSPRDRGAHRDMDARTFRASLEALRGSFGEAARAARLGLPAGALRDIGVAAEGRMLRATRGVNTHRGAIFALGLLAAAAGRARARAARVTTGQLRDEARRIASDVLGELPSPAGTHGASAAVRHGVTGARGEAAEGFPHVFDVALPALRRARDAGAAPDAAAVHALMELVAVLPDTNLLHRGGPAGLEFARATARRFVEAGGVRRAGWERCASAAHRAFVERGLSPGGSADLLAAALFVERICGSATP